MASSDAIDRSLPYDSDLEVPVASWLSTSPSNSDRVIFPTSVCGGTDRPKDSSSLSLSSGSSYPSSSSPSSSVEGTETMNHVMNHLPVETGEDLFSNLLELAANNDVDGFKCVIESDPSKLDDVGLWYGRQKGSNMMVLEHRTPLMVAALYGSVDVLAFILSLAGDVNRSCSPDKFTALHCAASGGSHDAIEVVKMLLKAGANPNAIDALGRRPFDVIMVSPKLPHVKIGMEGLLSDGSFVDRSSILNGAKPLSDDLYSAASCSPPLSSLDGSPSASLSTASPLSPVKLPEFPEKKEYPVDPSLPDIKNSIYATDEFRMFSFKVRHCSRAYSHDWTECPFVHPGENARRRDPRKFHYSCVPCPDFRKGACRRGDLCEYAHGVFECWLHPAQYRTRLCKDGTNCSRRVCFFAHTSEELRPLYVSTGSAVPSPRSSASTLDMAAAMAMSLGPPGSPSSTVSIMSPFSQTAVMTPPMSPSGGVGGHSSLAWPQPNVPTLHLPGSNLQSSRLRSSLSARDIRVDDFSTLPDMDVAAQQILSDYSCLARLGSAVSMGNGSSTISARLAKCKTTFAPSNLEELFVSEMSSPRFSADYSPLSPQMQASQKASSVFTQIQQQNPMLSPINTGNGRGVFSQNPVDVPQLNGHSSLLQSTYGLSSSRISSPRSIDPASVMAPSSPLSLRLAAFAQREKQQQQQLRSNSSRELSAAVGIMGSPSASASPWPKWGSPTGKAEWGMQGDELGMGRFQRAASAFDLGGGCCPGTEEPDLSWVQSLVKESPEMKEPQHPEGLAPACADSSSGQLDPGSLDHSQLGMWLEQLQLDQQLLV